MSIKAAFFEKTYQQHPLWQTFADATLEQRYQEHFETRNRTAILFSALLACILYPLFGVLDYIISDDVGTIWFLRSVFGWVPLLLLALAFWRGWIHGHYHLMAFMAALCSGLAVVAMLILGNDTIRQHYPYGVSLVILFATIPFFIRFGWLVVLAGLLFGALCVVWGTQEMSFTVIASQAFIISCAMVLTCGGGYYIERFFRGSFLNQELEAALRTSQELHRAKNDFIAVVSHELKTPLTIIRGNGEILRDELFGAYEDQRATYRQLTDDLCTQALHLQSIINDLLDISKAQAGQLELTMEAFDMVAETTAIITQMQTYPSQHPFTLTVDTTLKKAIINADKRRLRQVLLNLLSNAIKFNRPNGRIVVMVSVADDSLRCIVRDEGIGIATEDQQRIFEPFQQAKNAAQRLYDGTGLGLPLVKSIINAHNGQLIFTSTINVGTTIGFTIPLNATPSTNAQI